jgi:iron-sulfur cluster repair protein YtfE (RIC family)
VKRSTELMPLSREHHEALVLARRACEPHRPHADATQLRPHILSRWTEQFAPHFACEERVLFPALRAAGAREAADEARAQHEHIRSVIDRLRDGDLAALPAWGDAMREHVKWEERVLFPLAEQVLDLPALATRLDPVTQDLSCSP